MICGPRAPRTLGALIECADSCVPDQVLESEPPHGGVQESTFQTISLGDFNVHQS